MQSDTPTDPTEAVNELSAATIDLQPSRYFWDENRDGWHVCFSLTDEERQRDTYEPLSNYKWPLPDHYHPDFENIRDRLHNMTLVCVDADPEPGHYLGLTGVGMDMSPGIARTYISLGYLPPAHLELPGGPTYSPLEVAAMQKSYSLMCDRYSRRMQDLEGLERLEIEQ